MDSLILARAAISGNCQSGSMYIGPPRLGSALPQRDCTRRRNWPILSSSGFLISATTSALSKNSPRNCWDPC